MSNDEQRIRLAEWMGWKRVTLKTFGGAKSDVWESPSGRQAANSLPNPREDANDCEALIEFLNERKYDVEVTHGTKGTDYVFVGRFMKKGHKWKGDDWKHGVCDLADKVRDDGLVSR